MFSPPCAATSFEGSSVNDAITHFVLRSGDVLQFALSTNCCDRGYSYQAAAITAGAGRSFAAILTRSARESACIFCMTLPRCAFTVISLMPSSPPICLFNKPETTSAITCRSRRESDA